MQLREVGATSAEAALRAGNIDLMICERVPDGYVAEPLTTIALLAVVASTHRLAGQSAATSPRDLGRTLRIDVQDARIGPRWSVTAYDSAAALVAQGHGFAWLPEQRIHAALKAGSLKAAQVGR